VFGRVMVSPPLLEFCTNKGLTLSFLSYTGRFIGRIVGPRSGNIHLRLAQHDAYRDPDAKLEIAKNFVAGKLSNARSSVLRSRRDCDFPGDQHSLSKVARYLGALSKRLERAVELNEVRGVEGEGAHAFFGTIETMMTRNREVFRWRGRSRRPPKDEINALLSFLYAILLSDCASALESVGLDPQLGYLHAVRPGRPSLALDLEEEFRPVLADRLALTLINRGQLESKDFERRVGGACSLTDAGRRTVIVAYQKRKEGEVNHSLLERSIPLGLIIHTQARLLARHLRHDLPSYPPFLYS